MSNTTSPHFRILKWTIFRSRIWLTVHCWSMQNIVFKLSLIFLNMHAISCTNEANEVTWCHMSAILLHCVNIKTCKTKRCKVGRRYLRPYNTRLCFSINDVWIWHCQTCVSPNPLFLQTSPRATLVTIRGLSGNQTFPRGCALGAFLGKKFPDKSYGLSTICTKPNISRFWYFHVPIIVYNQTRVWVNFCPHPSFKSQYPAVSAHIVMVSLTCPLL